MRAAPLFALALAMAACVNAELVPCGELACPPHFVCTSGGCATPENAAACAGLAESDLCATNSVADGACHGGACRPIVCADGVLDLGEACDDGNAVAGDGCSATCESTERCGNDVVDLNRGEQCDAGRFGVSNDGCSSSCLLESESWRDVSPRSISSRTQVAMAFDAARGELILFGGATFNDLLDGTWSFNGLWRRRETATKPSARAEHVMVYDAARAEIVMFGGADASGALAETWVWDGTDWTLRHPAVSPRAQTGASATYDADRGRIVLFGAAAGSSDSETWEWDGMTWLQRTPATAPPADYRPAMTYDATGGYTLMVSRDGTTWQWNGTDWTNPGLTALPQRFGRAMAFDAVRGVAVLVGGAGGYPVGDTLEWTGGGWTPVASLVEARYYHAVAYDAALDRIVVFGGETGNPNGALLADTEFWNGTAWSAPNADAEGDLEPHRREGASMVFDSERGRVVLYGGCLRPYPVCFADTWEWDGTNWLSVAAMVPSARGDAAMTYDVARRRTLLFGGGVVNSPTLYDETWEFDAGAWTQRTPASSPSARKNAAIAFDTDRALAVLFGGKATTAAAADTWEWDGSTWLPRATTGPSARTGAALAYDRARKQTVLFGGMDDANQTLADTWIWDGSAWEPALPSTSPPARAFHALAYDPLRQRVVLFGGDALATFLGDVWEWDGSTWTASASDAPPVRRGGALSYDAIHRELVSFGGRARNNDNLGDTWVRRFDTTQPSERCLLATADEDLDGLVGCADLDCWGRCSPDCVPGETCAANLPRCGDGTCSAVEDRRICPVDCP